MENRELKKIIDLKILSGGTNITADEACLKKVQDKIPALTGFFGNLTNREGAFPFYYAKTGKELLLVDHVVFDSRKQLSRQVENLLNIFEHRQGLKKAAIAGLTGQFKKLPSISKGTNTARNYLANCAVAFGNKYDKLETYKKMLKDEGILLSGMSVKTCFVIQDNTSLGSYIVGREGMGELVLFYVKQFLDLFEKADGLDCAFFGCFTGCSDLIWFMDRNDIRYYRKKEMDLIRKNYFAFDADQSEKII